MLGLFFGTTTAPGVQCPTARVQTVTKMATNGTMVAMIPQPGDVGFVQCRCKERDQQQAKDSVTVSAPALMPDEPVIPALPICAVLQLFADPPTTVVESRRAPPIAPPRSA